MDTATRRKLLQTGLAAALLAAGGMPVAAADRTGGRLRIGLSGGPGAHRWAPHAGFGLFQSLTGAGLLFDTLTEIAPDGLLRGSLATSWTPAQGGAVWTLDLDPEARFHDQRALVAEDVIASLDLHLRPGAPGFGLRGLVAGMEVLSPHRLRFLLHRPNPDFPYLLSDPVLPIGPSGQLEEAFATGLGTGPYRLTSFESGRLLAERVRSHPAHGTGNWFNTVEVLTLPDADLRAAALLEGRVDVVDRLPVRHLARLRTLRGARMIALPATEYIAISVGAACPPEARETLLTGLRTDIDRAALVRAEGLHPTPHDAFDATSGALAACAPSPFLIAMDADLGEDGARLVGSLAAQLRAKGVDPQLAGAGTAAHLHVYRAPMRATLDWTLRAASHAPDIAEADAVDWARPEARAGMLARASETGPQYVPLVSDANLVVSDRISRPATTGEGWDLAHARMARRWWRSAG